VAVARLLFGPAMGIQAPPNLTPAAGAAPLSTQRLLEQLQAPFDAAVQAAWHGRWRQLSRARAQRALLQPTPGTGV